MPNIVKGSKQERMVVVPHRPVQRVIIICLAIVLIAGTGFSAYEIGLRKGASSERIDGLSREQLTAELTPLQEENASLRSQVALLDRSSVMDQQVSDEVQTTILSLRARVAELEQDNLSYRQAMSEEFEDVGLVIDQMDIESTDRSDRFTYKLVMRQQEADSDTFLTGHVKVSLLGTIGDESLEVPLYQLSDTESSPEIKLRFRFFQNIEGELVLPEGFKPEQIRISAVSTAPMAKTIDRSFNWVVEGG